MHGHMTVKFIN